MEYALVAYFKREGWLPAVVPPPPFRGVDQLPVVSGSVSPITAQQIAHAARHGFRVISLDASRLLGGDANACIEDALSAALSSLADGGSPLICSAQGPDDPAVTAFRAATVRHGVDEAEANATLGAALGTVLSRILDCSGLTRAVVSGGDTSGAVTQHLGVRALTALGATTPGAALFKADRGADRKPIELALKGGQMGSTGLFAWLRDGQDR